MMRRILLALFALAFATTAQAQNYTATQGTGTTFGSKLVSTVNYPQIVFCDPATPAQCVGVNASGQMAIQAPPTLPLPTGAATSANQTTANTSLATIATNSGSAIPAGTNSIGAVGSDPSSGKATPTSAFLALPATATTQIVALSGTKVTYVTSYRFMAGGAVNVTFKYGTGANCGTGTTTLEGPWPLTAQAGMTAGSGLGAILIVPSGQALCVTTDASVTGGVALSYQQF